MDMGLVQSFSAMKQSEYASKVQFAVAKKMLDSQELAGQAALKLLESAATAGDAYVAAATGLGKSLDVYG